MSKNTSQPPRLELAGIDENTVGTAQEAVPVPCIAGEIAVPLHWISPIYNQFPKEAPADRQGKK